MTKITNIRKEKFQTWYRILEKFLESDAYNNIGRELIIRSAESKILPDRKDMFRAFTECKYEDLKVVILGDEPYSQVINKNSVSDGLAFSYKSDEFYGHTPLILKNIFQELQEDVGDEEYYQNNTSIWKYRASTDLTDWANQGVLLLNKALTTQKGKAGEHLKIWDNFTQYVIKQINDLNSGVIFCLWGKDSHKYEEFIDSKNHIIKTESPSPIFINNGEWFGSKTFSKVNNILKDQDTKLIQWGDLPF